MLKLATLLLCFGVPLFVFSQSDSAGYSPVQTKYSFDWGNNSTSIRLSQYGSSTKTVMIHLHDDETASDKAAEVMLRKTGGLLIEVENNGKRLMSFKKSGRWFLFDPNRIFTNTGLKKNLRLLNSHVTSAAISSVKAFAAFILQKIPDSLTSFISLHNNENGKYSIKSYTPLGSRAKDALKVHINPLRDPDNFFILTDTILFRQLKQADFNVVLQNTKNAVDDGSLSIYLGRKNIIYVNVEAQKGRMRTQVNMLHALLNRLH
ncbi:MAG TPA: hypothetical protein VGI82_05445 [Chitinophagaceae bacterium]|jgi:hypothetical protein